MQPEIDPTVITCANCRTPMPRELRFCRSCGYRLGEGTAEYTETVRFQNAAPGTIPAVGSAGFNPQGGPIAAYPAGPMKKRKRRMSGMSWMFLGLLIFFVIAAGLTAIIRPVRNNIVSISQPAPSRSYFGVDNFDTAENETGVTFSSVEPPGGPADLAGLIGGDVITSFDGQPVREEDQIDDLLQGTPVGKTVEIAFVRDGETKTTKLTTVNREEFERLVREFRRRPVGIGRFGYEEDESERVPVPGTNLFGVRLDNISSSMPADMAGIKEGDIVIEFDGVPIRTPEELHSRVRRAEPYTTVKVVVMRGSEKLEIPVKMGKL